MVLQPGSDAPPIPGATHDGAAAIAFYKVTCPTCQMAAPAMERLHDAAPERFTAVVQDPAERAAAFADEYGTTFSPVVDPEPYEISDAYGIRTVPTVFLVHEGRIEDVAESWDREGWNRLASRLGELTGRGPIAVSEEGDGLPAFRPG